MSPRSSSVGSFAAESLHSASPWSGTKDDRVLLHFQFTRPILHARGLKVPAKQPSAAGSGWPIDRAFGCVKTIDVIDVPSDLFIRRGVPAHIRSHDGPEFVAKAVQEWIAVVGSKTGYIERGSPWQDG